LPVTSRDSGFNKGFSQSTALIVLYIVHGRLTVNLQCIMYKTLSAV